jgi:hypothetical protein
MRRLALLAPLALLACGDKDVEPYTFDEGTYTVQFDEVDGTGCGYTSVYLRNDAMEVGVTATLDGMRYTYPDATTDEDSTDCDMVGAEFDCAPLTQTQDLTGQGYEAVITVSLGQSGEWTAPDAHDGDFVYTFSCEGEDCAGGLDGTAYGADAEFPCDLTGGYSAKKAD